MSTTVTPADILAPHTEPVRDLANALRELVVREVPGVTERAYPGWRALGFHDEQSGYFCGVFPSADRVRLLFEHGVALPDPEGVLQGSGKQVRYVELQPEDPIPLGPIRELIREALLFGAVR
jgi:hypothetical protein